MSESESSHTYEQDTAESSSGSENDIVPYSYKPSNSADDSEAEYSNSVNDRFTDSSW